MAASHVTKVFACKDAAISLLTADSSSAPTYSTKIDIPGITRVQLTGELKTVDLRGDFALLDTDSSLQSLTLAFDHGQLSLDALAAMLGQSVTDSGTTPNQKATLSMTNVTFPYFKFEAATPTGGGAYATGDVHLVVWKCKLASMPPIGLVGDDYAPFSVQCKAVQTVSNSKYFDVVINETAAAIS